MPFLVHSEQLFESPFSRIFRRSNQLKIGTESIDTLVKHIKTSKNLLGVLFKLPERLKLKMAILSVFSEFWGSFLEHF